MSSVNDFEDDEPLNEGPASEAGAGQRAEPVGDSRFRKAVHAGVPRIPKSDFHAVPGLVAAWRDRRDPAALARLTAIFKPMIQSMAAHTVRHYGHPELHDDMVAEATLQMIRAIDRYEPAIGSHFVLFSRYPMKGAMLHLCNGAGPMRVGTTSAERVALGRMPKLEAAFEKQHGRAPSQSEADIQWLAAQSGCAEHSIQVALSVRQHRVVTIDSIVNEVGEPGMQAVEAAIDADRIGRMIEAAFAAILAAGGRHHARIVQAMRSEEPSTVTAAALGISTERVGQIRRNIQTDMGLWLKARGINAEAAFA